MPSLPLLLLPTLSLLAPLSAAQAKPVPTFNPDYTVWSSVIFTRTGDRTPVWFTGGVEPYLTALGASQAHEVGAFLRDRYLGAYSTNGSTGTMPGLSVNTINPEQMFIGTPNTQYSMATAQSLMQGFYPPTNATSTLANTTHIATPFNGYQYPMIQTYGSNDPEAIFLNAQNNCPAWYLYAEELIQTPEEVAMGKETESLYATLGRALFDGYIDPIYWNSQYAWPIWDWLNYQNTWYSNVSNLLDEKEYYDDSLHASYLDLTRYYSDAQLQGFLGTINATNPRTSIPFSAPTGSISTIAGNFLASQVLGQLQQAIRYKSESYKLSLLFGDFEPLISLFTLLELPSQSPDFLGIPNFASSAIFELYSRTDGAANPSFPDESDLYVRFYFRNGTQAVLTAYTLFGIEAEQFNEPLIDLPWARFSEYMYALAPGNASDWCTQCAAEIDGGGSVFCAYSNASLSLGAGALLAETRPPVSPVIAGVIGALVALVFALLIFGAVMLCAGVRFHRVYSRRNSEVGGYKGSAKLASDKDLVIPKGGATSVVSVLDDGDTVRGGHERVGSWELKQNSSNAPPHYQHNDDHDIGEAPWQKPVEPEERV